MMLGFHHTSSGTRLIIQIALLGCQVSQSIANTCGVCNAFIETVSDCEVTISLFTLHI